MPLAKQVLPLNFGGGIDTKSDPKTLPPGKLLALENGVFRKANRLSKRNGYAALTQDIENPTGGSTITSGKSLATFRNELCAFSDNVFFSYSDSTQKWIQKGSTTSVGIDYKTVAVDNAADSRVNQSVDHNSGISVYAFEQGLGTNRDIYYTVIDQATGSQIVGPTFLSTDDRAPVVVSFQDKLVIFYSDRAASNIYYQTVDVSNPSVISGVTTVINDANTAVSRPYDMRVVGDRLFISYYDSSNTLSVRYLDSAFMISAATVVAVQPSACIGTWGDDSDNVWIGYGTGSVVGYVVLDNSLSTVYAAQTIESIVALSITGAWLGNKSAVYYSINAAQSYNRYIKNAYLGSSVLAPAGVFCRSISLAGKAFVANGSWVIPTIHQSNLQSTYFIFADVPDAGSGVVAKVNPTVAGFTADSHLSILPSLSAGEFLFSCGVREKTLVDNRVIVSGGVGYSLIGVASAVLNFTSVNRYQNAEIGELYIAGGFIQTYDGGMKVVEDNFHLFPENISTSTSTTGGSMEAGSYQYVGVYEWTDSLGQIHKSATSVPVTQVVPAGTSTNTVTVTVPTLRITAKDNVFVTIYRTQKNVAGPFYRVTDYGEVANVTSSDTIAFIDTLADSSISSREPLYTTGGILENDCPQPASLITTYKNRVFLAGLQDSLTFQYSKVRQPGAPVEFSNFFIQRIDPRGGPVTALGAMDDFVVFFKRNLIFVFSGNGPNDLGTQSDYQDPILVSSDVGCVDPNSVVLTPDGLMFKSNKGICILYRNLSVEYIGAEVEDYNSLTITSSTRVSTQNQVRFATSDGPTLVYDYFFKQWSTFTNHQSADAVVWNDRFSFIKDDGQVLVENDGFSDNGTPILLSFITSWFAFAGIQAFQRVYRMLFLGDYKSPHSLLVEIGYDYEDSYTQSALLEFPVSPGVYQYKTHMTRQKCESLRFKFTESQSSPGEGLNLTNMAFEVGVKKGTNKMAVSQSFATAD